jgi:hypothetical protein
VHRLPPVDQCAADRSFADFRRRLTAAIDRQSAAYILRIAVDDIEYSFGEAPGRAGFAALWELDSPATSRLWRELGAALRLGCARDRDGALWAPSMSMPSGDEAAEDFGAKVVATTPGAILRAAASDDGAAVARLEWDVLTLRPDDDGESAWLAASLADGRRGYVRRSEVRSPADFRAVFEKRDGRWRMTAFVAGD